MASSAGMQGADGFGLRAGFFYAALLLAMGILVPFFPLWLEARQLNATQIGIVVAAPMLVRVIAAPIVARMADRADALRGTLIVACALSVAMYVAVGFARDFLTILVMVSIAGIFLTPIGSLADAYTIKGAKQRGVQYGRVRLWGSVAFIVANLGAGLVLQVVAAQDMVWLIVMALGLMMLAGVALRPVEITDAQAGDLPATPIRFRWTPVFVCVVVGAGLIQASHAIFYSFSSVHWTNSGLEGGAVGALWALGVAAEVLLFWFATRLFGKLPPTALIAFGAGGAVIRWVGMAFDPPVGVLLLLQPLHALSFGATHLGSVQFVASVAPRGAAATVQGDLATIQSSIGGVCTMLAGVLYANTGQLSYGVMAALAGVGGALVLAARWMRPKI
jgi:PPP family 3-phenylpropionic acid transporter